MLDELKWDEHGLVTVVIVDARSGDVLTVAHANRAAVELTLKTGETHLWSRSRAALWRKGESSGNTQRVLSVDLDCDGDALVYRVEPAGPACHTGERSCFFRSLSDKEVLLSAPSGNVAEAESGARARSGGPMESVGGAEPGAERLSTFEQAIRHLIQVIELRRTASPEESYVAKLFARGVDRIAKKIGEEATEVVIAAKNDDRGELVWEVADLFFHTLVLLAQRDVEVDEIGAELLRRAAR